MPEISVPMVGVQCVIFVAADKRLFFSGSALCATSVTGNSVRGSHLTSGQYGCNGRTGQQIRQHHHSIADIALMDRKRGGVATTVALVVRTLYFAYL